MAEPDAVARVFVLGGPDVGRSFEIRSQGVLGRGTDCEVRLHDRSISRRHARIEHDGARWFVVDQGSTNGVSKNGRRVERAELADCDEFLLGELPLRFRLGPAETGAVELAEAAKPPPRVARAPAPPEQVSGTGDAPAEIEQEIELEEVELEEIEIEEPAPASSTAGSRTERAARSIEPQGSFFSGDLAQRPLWLRVLLTLLVLALSAGLFVAAFEAVKLLRGSV